MAYEYLPLPQPTTAIPPAFGSGARRELERLDEMAKSGGSNMEYLPALRAIADQVESVEDSINSTQLNAEVLSSKFPIAGQDQNMQRAWNSLTFGANWQNLNVNGWPCRCRRTSEGMVFVQGIATNTAGYAYGGANQKVATLPVGSRPISYVHREIKGFYDAGYGVYVPGVIMEVTTGGDINLIGGVPGPAGAGSGAAGAYIYLYFSFWAV